MRIRKLGKQFLPLDYAMVYEKLHALKLGTSVDFLLSYGFESTNREERG